MTDEQNAGDPRQVELVKTVTDQYLGSTRFNGFPLHRFPDLGVVRPIVADAVSAGILSVTFGDRHPNPHIQAFEPEETSVQLNKLSSSIAANGCLYPTRTHLRSVVRDQDYAGRPYTLLLALGEPQLNLLAFDLRVLEQYRSDPRYQYTTDDIQGSISVADAFFESESMSKKDQVIMQNFGFGYDREVTERVAVAFVYDLHKLSPEHQQIWTTHQLQGDYLPHPDFWRAMMGEWPERASIFQAFGEELRQINAMCQRMGRPPLFRNDYADENRPREFGFLIRPTLAEYNGFVLLLDKMMSDNVSLDFFQGDVDLETLVERKDGIHVAQPKGSIAVLDEWLNEKFRPADRQPVDEAIATFRRVRKERQSPAHAVKENVFDQKFFRDQRDLIIEAYAAVRTIRLIFANHPAVRGHEVPDWLFKGEIWSR
jgi:hypothetical protein